MEVDAYVQARYGRLLEHAVELGAPEGLAAEYVDEVLRRNRARIRRARDPDPLVREALARAVAGRRDHGRSGLAVLLVVASVAVVGLAALTFSPDPEPVPSLAGYRADEAEQTLTERGWDVVLRQATACEPVDQVLDTVPAAGSLLGRGSVVSVRVAVPTSDCEPVYAARTDAWALVRWSRGLAPPPDLAPDATVLVDGGPAPLDAVRDLVGDEAAAPVSDRTGPLRLVVDETVPTDGCGPAAPPALAGREALHVVLERAPEGGGAACPLTVDLYRDDAGATDAVVVRTGSG